MPRPNIYQEIMKPEVMQELKAFAAKLNTILTTQADMDTSRDEDLGRLKIYYDEEGEVKEVTAFNPPFDYKLDEDDEDYAYKKNISPNLTNAERDILRIESNLTSILANIEKEPDYYQQAARAKDVEFLYEMMTAAKEGRLMVTKPGEVVKKSHPIVMDEAGNLEFLPEKDQASPEQRSKVHYDLLEESPHYEDQKYADELKSFKDTAFVAEALKTKFLLDNTLSRLCESAFNRGITKEQLLAKIDATELSPDRELVSYVNNIRETYNLKDQFPKFKPITSGSAQRKRTELSKRARHVFLDASYDINTFRHGLKDGIQNGYFTQEEFDSLNKGHRDLLCVLLEISNEPAAHDRNIERLRMLLGKGVPEEMLNSEDPKVRAEAIDMKKQMAASVFNEAAKQIAEFDYSQLVGLTDEEIVNKWPQIGKMAYKLSVTYAALDEFAAANPDNQYIDAKYMKAAQTMEAMYNSFYFQQVNHIRYIASPNYAVFPTEEAVKYSELSSIETGNEYKDISGKRFLSYLEDTTRGEVGGLQWSVTGAINKAFNLPMEYKATYYDREGNEIKEFKMFDELKAGHPVFAASLMGGEYMKAFTLDPKTQRPVINDKVLNDPRYNAAKERMKPLIQKAKDKFYIKNLDEMYFDTRTTYTTAYKEIVLNANKQGINKGVLIDHIKAVLGQDPSISKEDFFKIPGALEDGEKIPSDAEINQRRIITNTAHWNLFDFAYKDEIAYSKFDSLSLTKRIPGLNRPRQFARFLVYWEDELNDAARNAANMETFVNAGTEARKALVIQRFRDYQAQAKDVFDQPMTDEHIAKNAAIIRSVGVPMGMEYDEFMTQMRVLGIEFEPEIRKEMDEFHHKVYAYMSIAQNRIDAVMSPFYRYKANPGEALIASAMGSKDKMLSVWGMKSLNETFSIKNLTVQEMVDKATGYNRPDYEFITDGETVYKLDESNSYYHLLNAEKPLFIIKSGSPEMVCCIPKGAGVPVEIEMVDLERGPSAVSAEDRIDFIYGVRKEALKKNKSLDKVQLKIEENFLDAKRAFSKAMEKGNYADEELTQLIADATIKNLCSNKHVEKEVKASLVTDEMRQKVKKDLMGSDLVNRVIKELPQDRVAIESMSADDLYKCVITAQKALAKDADKKQYEEHIDKLREKYNISDRTSADVEEMDAHAEEKINQMQTSINNAANMFNTKFFLGNGFNEAALKEIKDELESESTIALKDLEGAGLSGIALGIMLSTGDPNAEISAEAAFAPESEAERNAAAKAAVRLIAEGSEMSEARIRDYLLTGIEKLNTYIDKKLGTMSELSGTELAKPGNEKLLAAMMHAKAMVQQFKAIQEKMPQEERIETEESKAVFKKSSDLERVVGTLLKPAVKPADYKPATLKQKLTDYLIAASTAQIIKDYKAIAPEGSPLTSYYNGLRCRLDASILYIDSRDAVDALLASDSYKNLKEEDIKRVMTAMADDSLREDLNITVEREGAEPVVHMDLDGALKRAFLRKPLEIAEKNAAAEKAQQPKKDEIHRENIVNAPRA